MSLGDPTKLKDALVFVNNPPAAEATQLNAWPFTIMISAGDTGSHYIDLYSQYSRSSPYQQPQNRWSHLVPQWRFLDLSGNYIPGINTTDTQITNASGEVIGVTGTAQFYYVDDMPSADYASPVMLWATMQVSGIPVDYDIQGSELPGYANSKIIKGETYYINGQPPTYLSVTRNGVNNIDELKWINNPFRYTTVTKSNWLAEQCPGSSGAITIFDYPQEAAEAYAATHEIHRDLLGVPLNSETWNPLSAYFVREDPDTLLHTGGYHIGSVASSAVSLNTRLTAEVGVEVYPWFRDISFVWVSNGANRTINRVNLPYNFGGYTNPLIPDMQTYSANLSGMASLYTVVSSISGTPYWVGPSLSADNFGGIYGLAQGGFCGNSVWGVDSELDTMFRFGTNGTITNSVSIGPSGSSPQAIAMDSELNMWVTLYGALSTVKYDSTGTSLFYAAVPPYAILDQYPVSGSDPDGIRVRPVQVDTDTDDNIWVTYEHALSSLLMKYNDMGVFVSNCNLPVSSQPQGVVVDPIDNSVWVTNTYEIIVAPYSWSAAGSAGNIQKYDTNGTLLSTFDNIPHPGHITLDYNKNAWFTFGYSGLGVISGGQVTQYFLTGGDVVPYSASHIAIDDSTLPTNDRIKGLACDSRNRIWALESDSNTIYVINPEDTTQNNIAVVSPRNLGGIDHSIQGMGDWTGFQWLQKYYYGSAALSGSTYTIQGSSNEFNIDEFGSNFEIRRFNESWDATKQMRDYALSDHIYDNESLFNAYLSAMVGGVGVDEESIGRKSYERIANFVPNHVDIDTCGIDQLYALADELDVPIDDYNLSYPVSLRRLMDIVSISHQRLWGTRCKCRRNFEENKSLCTECNHSHCLNRSTTRMDTSIDTITGGEEVVIRPIFGSRNYDLLISPSTITSGVSTLSVYPIDAAPSLSWLSSADYGNYYFYRYIPTDCDVQVEGVINWDDDYTTLMESDSSLSAWYDRNELVDTILNYDLHQGLQFNMSGVE